jgi:hypothetical protein
MVDTATDTAAHYCYVTTDEVGKRIAGYTVRGANGTTLCKTMDDVEKVVGSPEKFVWANLDDAKIHYTRQPGENWGFATESITVRHYDSESRKIVESEVKRDSVPFDRYDFADY